jgi:hypothetical protein
VTGKGEDYLIFEGRRWDRFRAANCRFWEFVEPFMRSSSFTA